jgi:ubiquinone/menaquinone biosynthesis C-methylase UbiE
MMSESDIAGFLAISREVFAPLYPYYAAMFLERSGLADGRCLDVGCGGGALGLAVAERCPCRLVLLDQAPAMLRAAAASAAERGLAHRAWTLAGDVQALPLGDASLDLVVSRGSVMFWQDLPRAFAEIDRVLAPGGRAYLGGGLGPPETRRAICREMAKRDARWSEDAPPPPRPGTDPDRHARALHAAGIADFTITREDTGHWIEIRGRVR